MDKSTQFDEFVALNLIGRSAAFTKVLKMVKQIAAYDVSVSIYGETGTGKELIARAIHYLSPRENQPFIPINCGSLPDTLFENEMFGHERGAFTDAKKTQAGLIAQADGGTLFLDEIEALSLKAQATLLRFLQDKQYRTLGGSSLKTADVRIVVASNANLKHLCGRGAFREDLYYRLNVMPLTLPPLRARTGDIRYLTEHFLRCLRIRYEKPARQLHASVMEWVTDHDWPGNIRELENTLHRAFLLAEDDVIRLEHIRAEGNDPIDSFSEVDAIYDLAFNEAKSIAIDNFEKYYLDALMDRCGGNVTLAATQAGKERRALGRLLNKHALRPQDYKRPQGLD